MMSTSEIINAAGRKNGDSVYFFVSKFIPFVSCENSLFTPFIRKNIPNTSFQPNAPRSPGFTLIELIVTMAVAAILVAVAIPNLRTFIQNGRLNTQANDLIGDLNLARSEAIKRRMNVGITTSPAGACATGGNWRNGRVIFVDLDRDNSCDANEIIRFREPLAVLTDTLTTTVVGDPIFFSANGQSPNFLPGAPTATFTFCDDRGPANGKLINLNFMGQAAVSATPPLGC